jgi:hypothetical protein
MNEKEIPKNLQSTTGGAVMREWKESEREFRWTFQRRHNFPWLKKNRALK